MKSHPNSTFDLANEFAFIERIRDPHVLRGYIEGMKKRVRGFGTHDTMTAEQHSQCIRLAYSLLRERNKE